jgi:hypothetical protein
MKKTTTNNFNALGTGDSAVQRMIECYKAGEPITDEILADVPPKWIVRLASIKYPELRFVWAGIAFRYESQQHPVLAEYADGVTAGNCLQAQDAAQADGAMIAYSAAWLAADRHVEAIEVAYAAAYANDDAVWSEMADISVQYLLSSK